MKNCNRRTGSQPCLIRSLPRVEASKTFLIIVNNANNHNLRN